MELPKHFPPTPPLHIINYSFTDIATGKGILELDGSNHYNGNYKLITNNIRPQDNATFGTTDTDVDFDMEIQAPLIMEGSAIISYSPFMYQRTGSASGTHTMTTTATIRKVSGGTEDDIVSITSETYSTSTLNANEGVIYFNSFELTVPQTKFKKGDILRVNIVTTRVSGTVQETGFYHDPLDETATLNINTAKQTRLTAYLPVVINQ